MLRQQLIYSCSIGTIALAVLGLVSYIPGLALLGSLSSNFIPMAPSTAVSFALLGIAVYLVKPSPLNLPPPNVVRLAAILVAVFGLLEVLGYLTHLDLNYEDKVVPYLGQLGNVPIGRMSPSTGGFFFCSGIAFLLFPHSYTKKRYLQKHLSGFLSVIVLLGSITFILGYLYRTPFLYDNKTIPMALTTALGFLFLSVGLISCISPGSFPVNLFLGDSTRGKLMQTFLPLTFSAVLTQGLLPLFTQNFIDINNALSSAILMSVVVTVTALAVISISRIIGNRIDRVEQERIQAEKKLREAHEELELRIEARTSELTKVNKKLIDSEARFRSLSEAAFEGIVISERGTIIEANDTISKMFGYQLSDIVGMTATNLVSPEEKQNVTEKISSDYELPYESKGLKKDGSIFPIEVHAKMFTYKGRRVRVAAIRDLTEQRKAEEEIRTLRGILPICSFCKNIRNDEGYYEQLEGYIHKHSGVDFSHTICPPCMKKYHPKEYEHLMTKRKP